jgi:hypothetical protein
MILKTFFTGVINRKQIWRKGEKNKQEKNREEIIQRGLEEKEKK